MLPARRQHAETGIVGVRWRVGRAGVRGPFTRVRMLLTRAHPMSVNASLVGNLFLALKAHAQTRPDALAFRYLRTGDVDGPVDELSYGELAERAARLGAALLAKGATGERAVLMYEPGLDFVVAFFGCLYAGVIAVPVYPPTPARLQRSLSRMRGVVKDCGARFVLTHAAGADMAELLRQEAPELGSLDWLRTDELAVAPGESRPAFAASAVSIAFLQYTSGSTSEPRGVIVTHGNLWHNQLALAELSGLTPDSVVVSWLPSYHDMGLIGAIVQPVYSGCTSVLMAPVAFVQRPRRWLEAISHFKASSSPFPNFALDLCVRRIPPGERADLDLSSWALACNGAEPIRAESLTAFAEAFGPCGFAPHTYAPVYGLAEATLIVSGRKVGRGAVVLPVNKDALLAGRVERESGEGGKTDKTLVGCGPSILDQEIAIVDPATGRRRSAGQVGEIWVRGPSIAKGYWSRPEETERVFRARLADETLPGKDRFFLRTGDLGFLDNDELYVTGRLKDLVIIHGENHAPHDLELSVERAHVAVVAGAAAAFAVERRAGNEGLALLVGIDERKRRAMGVQTGDIIAAIREQVATDHDLQCHAVVLVKHTDVPRTTSGKIRRHACKEAYGAGTLNPLDVFEAPVERHGGEGVAYVAPRTPVEEILAGIFGEVLGIERVGIRDNFFEAGGHSLLATQVASRVRATLGIELPLWALFDVATVADLAVELERLGQRHNGSTLPALPPLVPVPRTAELPLSFAQERLWFLAELEPDSNAYNLSGALRLGGPLDVEALRRTFEEIAHRHEGLRARFESRGGRPVMLIDAPGSWSLPVVSLEGVPTRDRAAETLRLCQAEATRPFDLARGPLWRTTLLRLGPHEHVLVFAQHHIVSDAWSIALLVKEMRAFYQAFSRNEAPALTPLPLQYADFAAWQREILAGETLTEALAHFRERLAGVPPLELPTDRARPTGNTFRGASQRFTVPPPLTARLGRLSREHGATLFMTLLAAWQSLLARWSGQADFAVGVPMANRNEAALEGLIGFFANTLVLRAEHDGDPSFAELIGRVRAQALAAYPHQALPFQKLVDELGVEREPGRNPLFQVMFALQNMPEEEPTLGRLKVQQIDLPKTSTQFDLHLALVEKGGGLEGELSYATELFDEATITRLVGHFTLLLEGVTAAPDTTLSRLPLLRPDERTAVLALGRSRAAELGLAPAPEVRLHELFAAVAANQPEHIAVVCGDEALSYGELEARANRLAGHLQSLGIGRESLVGLYVERSVDLVVGVLGVLKAGAAYLPIDRDYPAERIAFMLTDAAVTVVLTQTALEARLGAVLPAQGGPCIVRLDGDREILASAPPAVPTAGSGDDLAYAIYTSGSTGQPKGVLVTHRNVVELIHSVKPFYGFTNADVFSLFHSHAFDVSVFEMWAAFGAGAKLVVVPYDVSRSPEAMLDLMGEQKVSVLSQTPSAFYPLLAAEGRRPAGQHQLRYVIFAGEALDLSLLAPWFSRYPGASTRLVNMYGITETTVHSTLRVITASDLGKGSLVGGPLPHLRLYLLDQHQSPVPIGTRGEIYVGGAGVARGYLQRPELTEARFLADPFLPGERLYRSGDLGRWHADGELEYCGRIDHQVKIRGFRVELGEIEARLQEHAGVERAVVLAREHADGDKRLVAYLVARAAGAVTVAALREHLKASLPPYMVPSAFVELAALPLTANGKIDRRSLPAPDEALSPELGRAGGFVAPRTPVEELLVGIFAEVLEREEIGIHDNFFELGGHSLMATQVVARVRSSFKVELPLRVSFEATSVAELAAEVEKVLATGAPPPPPIVPVDRREALPLSFAQQRLWFLHELEPSSSAYHVAGALRLAGELDVEALRRTFEELIRRHEVLRTRFERRAEGPVQIVAPPARWELPVVDLDGLDPAAQEAAFSRLAAEVGERPFDLGAGVLLRTTLLRYGPREHRLLMTLHHIAADGWSVGVLARELGALYPALARGEVPALQPLPIQYGDFASWQRGYLTGPVLEGQVDYWRGRLAGVPALELPRDRPRPAQPSHRGARHRFLLPATLVADLRRLGREHDATLFMTLLAGWQALLGRLSGQSDFAVGVPIANRTHHELEGLIGFFVNTLVFRAELGEEPSFLDLLGRVREQAVGAYTHQALPFERLVETLGIERDLSRNPLVQVMFALQNASEGEAAIAGLSLGAATLSFLELPRTTAQFDMTLGLTESAAGLVGEVEYNTDILDETSVARMMRHLETLLTAAVAAPESRIAELPLLDASERRLVLERWNDTTLPVAPATIHALIATQAAVNPGATALVQGTESLSYGGLEERATGLASELRGRGVGPGVLVGLCAERSIDMIVGLLAILKAGGGYVPLDPEYPVERLALMVQTANVKLVLGQRAVAARIEAVLERAHAEVLWLEDDRIATDVAPAVVRPDDVAYAIFTSGSTGRPKAVLCTHAGLVNLAANQRALFQLTADSAVVQFASLSFDASIWEIVMALSAGARLLLPSHKPPLGNELGRWQRDSGATMLTVPPSVLATLSPEMVPDLAQVVVAGEACPPELAAHWSVGRRFFNAYGPTETTVCGTILACENGDGPPSIGRPIGNFEAYVLDGELEPVPVGVLGELYLGGAGLARGYLGRPDLTAEAFVPHPFARRPGERLYRTGDLATWRADGQLEFRGRVDHQVKLRGFRIELGEIEAALLAQPGVGAAAVVVREDVAGVARLVAYVAPAAGVGVEAEVLRQALAGDLPAHLVPAVVLVLAALPLGPTGKIDRKALPRPEAAAPAPEDGDRTPRTKTERYVADLYAELLGTTVDRDTDFFAAGGHSLLATQVMARVFADLGLELPLKLVFEGATVAALAAEIDAAGAGEGAPAPEPLLARPDKLPLSFAQQRLWFLAELEPDSTAYHIPAVLHLRGPLSIERLTRAFTTLVARHEVLRTRFAAEAGNEPEQIIDPPNIFSLPVTDLTALAPSKREAEIDRFAAAEQARPFDLRTGPLLRAALLAFGAEEHVLVVTLHHIVADAWSVALLARELEAAYAGVKLPPLPVQYADHALAQRQRLAQDTEAMAYWRSQLADLPALALPIDHPRPLLPRYEGRGVRFTLPAALTAQLRRLGDQRGATLFMTLLGAFQVLLARTSGQRDFGVGVPIANRTRTELDGLIGFFVNTLVLRAPLEGDPSFDELLGRVRTRALDAYAHQELPFERLVEELGVSRELGRNPLFQVMFALETAPRDAALVNLPGLTATLRSSETTSAKFDLTLAMTDRGDVVEGELSYRRDLFDAATVERLAERLQVLLAAVATQPAQVISQLPLMTAAEQNEVLSFGRATATDAAPDVRLETLFRDSARRFPERTAVVFAGTALSYRQLDERSDRLAQRLRAHGAGPAAPVGLFVERSLDTVVGVLAILKAGAAYLPIDPAYPDERARFMLADAGVTLALTQPALEERLRAAAPGSLTLLTCEDTTAAEAAPLPAGSAADLAYVIYTSGSTGVPKGVLVTHHNVVRLVHHCQPLYRFTPDDVFTLFHSHAFDVSVFEMWAAFRSGSKLVVVPQETTRAPELMLDLLADEAVTVLSQTPSAFYPLMAAETRRRPGAHRLRYVIFAGEALDIPLLRPWFERYPAGGTRLVNMYGITETTVHSTFRIVGPDDEDKGSVVGRPLPDLRLYLLDERGQPVPIGVPGEIYVGGPGVARGYLARPELTEARFLADPFLPGERLYRSGDLGRWRRDGDLEYLGRIDHQVKIRGFRVELGEIEVRLQELPAVERCVVVARDHGGGDKRLAAYLVARPGVPGELSAGALREHLKRTLPPYMVPADFVLLDALPLTANGKVDRAALPAPTDSLAAARAYVAPVTPTETRLAVLFAEVLGRGPVGREDDFFELGGHSLMATQVVSRIRDAFGVDLPLRVLFQSPRVMELAAALAKADTAQTTPLVPVTRAQDLPLSFAQQRLWFLNALEPDSAAYHMPAAFRLTGTLAPAALEGAFAAVVARHEILRTRFVTDEGRAVQIIDPPGPFALTKVDFTPLPPDERAAATERLARADAVHPFDLARGPLLRATLVRLGEDDHVLLVTMHHIVSDGWSLGVLARALDEAYTALAAGRPQPELSLPLQYADYALWQRQTLAGPARERALDHWRKRLDGLPTLELPADHPRPAVTSYRGAQHTFTLPAPLSAAVAALARQQGTTIFQTLLAAWEVFLARLSGQSDFGVGVPVANRTDTALEGLIGPFVNTLVLRAELGDDPSFATLLSRVRDQVIEAQQHQSLPFEAVVDAVAGARRLDRNPLFQAFFALQLVSEHQQKLGALRLQPLPVQKSTAQFDVTLTMAEEDGQLRGEFEYSTDLFTPATMARWQGHFVTLLEAAVAAPSTTLSALPLLSPAERRQVLHDFNERATRVPGLDQAPHGLMHELFAAAAARAPEAIALVCRDQRVSYGALEAEANRLAHHLQGLGVGPESLVGLCLPRTPDMIVALLAVLKAGGAYLPLDPEYPADRLAFMLADAGVKTVITTGAASAQVPAGLTTVALDGDAAAIATRPATPPPVAVTPTNLAYAIYTSGSTGVPKAALLTHGGLANLARSEIHLYGITPESRVLQFASFSFDTSTSEIALALCAGGTLFLEERQALLPGPDLAAYLAQHAITVLLLTPSALALLDPDNAPTARQLIVGGEACPADLAARWAGRCRFFNTYGPTEATVTTTYAEYVDGLSPPTIGQPLPHVRAYVLDAGRHPVPVGVTGELYIGGVGVARGYLNRPALDAERFLPDPFVAGDARMYRTGDLVRRRPDGLIDYLGRSDDQVKIRGFRIELGEIESCLAAHPQVQAAAVIAREDLPGERRLVAYLVPRTGEVATVSELRAHLQRSLPDYMVPAAFVMMDALPLTASDKIDRKRLPAPSGVRPSLAAHFVAPETEAEKTLAQIFGEALKLDRVGRDDNFFELGGDSILSIQIVARARRAGLGISARDIFEHPTVAGLAAVATPDVAAPAEEAPSSGEAPLAPIQRWFLDADPVDPHHFNQALWLVPDPRLTTSLLAAALTALGHQHDALRLRFARTDHAGWQQRYTSDAGELWPLEEQDLRGLTPSAQDQALASTAARLSTTLDLASGPLARAALCDLGPRGRRLFLVVHHLVVDGVSWRILLEDLQRACQQQRAGEAITLPPRTASYRTFTERLAAETTSGRYDAELSFWRSQNVAAPLPVDFHQGDNDVASTTRHELTLPVEETRALLHEAGAAYGTNAQDLLLAALARTIGEWTGSADVTLELEGHGRQGAGAALALDRTVGWFTTLYPLRLHATGAGEGELIKRVKEQLRQVPGGGEGHGVLRYLHPDPAVRSSLTVAPALTFNYLGQWEAPADAMLAPAEDLPLSPRSPRGKRTQLLELDALVSNGQLQLRFTYSRNRHHAATIERLAARYKAHLLALIAHCRSPEAGGYTPSDFPLAEVDQATLDRLLGGE